MLTLKEPSGRGNPSPGRNSRGGNSPKRQNQKKTGAGKPAPRGAQPRRQRPPSRVPKGDVFKDLPKRRPPNLPGYEEEYAEYLRRKQEAAGVGEPPYRERSADTQRDRRQPAKAKAPAKSEKKPQEDARGQKQRNKRAKRPVNPAKRRRNRRIAAILAIIVLIGAGIGFCFGFLFKIETYTVQGESPYTKEEIVAAFHPRKGDNMFGFSAAEEAAVIEQTLPYLEKVTIRRRLTSNIVFQVKPATERYSLVYGEQIAVLSDTRKVLRFADAAPEGLTEIRGLDNIRVEPGFALTSLEPGSVDPPVAGTPASSAASQPQEGGSQSEGGSQPEGGGEASAPASDGSSVPAGSEASSSSEPEPADDSGATDPEDADRLELLDTLLKALDDSALNEITWVDVGDPLNLQFRWQDRITVQLGPKGNLEERMKFVEVLFTDPNQGQISQNDRGILDVSTYPGTDKVYLKPE